MDDSDYFDWRPVHPIDDQVILTGPEKDRKIASKVLTSVPEQRTIRKHPEGSYQVGEDPPRHAWSSFTCVVVTDISKILLSE